MTCSVAGHPAHRGCDSNGARLDWTEQCLALADRGHEEIVIVICTVYRVPFASTLCRALGCETLTVIWKSMVKSMVTDVCAFFEVGFGFGFDFDYSMTMERNCAVFFWVISI